MAEFDGMRVVVTRARHQADELTKQLQQQGADPVLVPVIGIGPPSDPEVLRRAAAHANTYDWIIFTSANAVNFFAAQLMHPASECTARVAAIGSATRDAAQARGFRVDVVPDNYVAEALVVALGNEKLMDCRILIPSAAVTRDVVPAALRKQDARVEVVEAYRNIIPPDAAAQAKDVFQPPYPEWVTFASPSAVDNLINLIGTEALEQTRIATIGPVTSQAVRKYGLPVAAEARIQTVGALVEAIRVALK